ncbi:MAG: hypothetical protein ACREP7_18315 [Lysobacter sp.]
MTRPAGEKTVRIAADLYEARDVARKAYGDTYAARVGPCSKAIIKLAEAKKISALQAAIQIAKDSTQDGHDVLGMLVLAAYVEMVEPTPGVTVEQAPPAMLSGAQDTAAAPGEVPSVSIEEALQLATSDGAVPLPVMQRALAVLGDEVILRWEQRTALSFRMQDLRSIAVQAGVEPDSALYGAIHDVTATAEAWLDGRVLTDAAKDHFDHMGRRIRELERELGEARAHG